MMRKVASSPLITFSTLTPTKSKMMDQPQQQQPKTIHRRSSATHSGVGGGRGGVTTLHRRQITPDSVVGTNIGLHIDGSFVDDCSLAASASNATTAGLLNANNSAVGSSSNPLLRPKTSSCSSIPTTTTAATTTSAAPLTSSQPQQAAAAVNIDQSTTQLHTILSQESSPYYVVTPDYLHSSSILLSSSSSSSSAGVSERRRRKTCEWMYELCDYFRLQREVVGVALYYVDRYFTITFGGSGVGSTSSGGGGKEQTTTNPVTKREFQLIGLTALYIAIKLHGQSRTTSTTSSTCNNSHNSNDECTPFNKLKFNIHICASTSRSQFTPTQIEQCELIMFQTLEWRLNPIVCSGCVVEHLVVCLSDALVGSGRSVVKGGASDDAVVVSSDSSSSGSSSIDDKEEDEEDAMTMMNHHGQNVQNFVYDCATYLTELAVSVAALSLVYKPSIIAYASILAALDILLDDDDTSSSLSFSGVTKETLLEYDRLLNEASNQHFEMNSGDVVKAKEILGVMAPNIDVLFPSPFEKSGARSSSPMSDEDDDEPTLTTQHAELL